MIERDAELRLYMTLLARRLDMREKLAGELAHLRDFQGAHAKGACAEAAVETVEAVEAVEAVADGLSSQLAESYSRELGQIDRALAALKQGA